MSSRFFLGEAGFGGLDPGSFIVNGCSGIGSHSPFSIDRCRVFVKNQVFQIERGKVLSRLLFLSYVLAKQGPFPPTSRSGEAEESSVICTFITHSNSS